MSQTADTKPVETPAPPAAAPPPKRSALGAILKFIVPAILAAGASYGGARGAAAHPPAAAAPHKVEAQPPGPTVALEPFLVTISDAKGKGHAMKVSLAVEFDHTQKEDALKPFASRIRDAILSYIRVLSFEDAVDGGHMEKLRAEMLERCHSAGATGAARILITDLVIQ